MPACWAACAWAVTTRPSTVLGGALACLGSGVLLAVRATRVRPARHRLDERPGTEGDPALWRGPPSATAALVCLAVAACLLPASARLAQRATDPLALAARQGRVVRVEAVVAAAPRMVTAARGETVVVDLAVERVDGSSSHAHLTVMATGAHAQWRSLGLGTPVEVSGRPAPAHPGAREIALVRTRAPARVLGPARGLLAVVDRLRAGLRQVVTQAGGRWPQGTGELVVGVALGDDSGLPQQVRDDFRAVSLTHLTAVSGQHVALVLAVVLTLTGVAPRRVRAVVGLVVLIGLVVLVRPGGSVLRAAVMGGVVLAGTALGRPAVSVPALSGAVVVLLVADTWQSRSWGLALSVAATAAIVLGQDPAASALRAVAAWWWGRWGRGPWAGVLMALARVAVRVPGGGAAGRAAQRLAEPGRPEGRRDRLAQGACQLVALPLVAQLACAPLLVVLSPSVGVWSVPANVVAAPVAGTTTVAGLLATLTAAWWPGAAGVLVWPALAGCAWLVKVAEVFAGLPLAVVPWPGGVGGAVALALIETACWAAVWRLGRARGGRSCSW